jgi:hypothetical protein
MRNPEFGSEEDIVAVPVSEDQVSEDQEPSLEDFLGALGIKLRDLSILNEEDYRFDKSEDTQSSKKVA